MGKENEMKTKLVQRKREQDGRFALLLESESAVQADLRRTTINRNRRQQVVAENADWAAEHGFDPAEMDLMFA
jgi:hypothetical protein